MVAVLHVHVFIHMIAVGSCRPDELANMTTTLLDLDDDALEAVLCSTSLRALGNLMCANKVLNSTLKSQALLDRLCESRIFSSGPSTHSPSTATQFHCSSDVVDSLEAVAVLMPLFPWDYFQVIDMYPQ